MCTFPLRSLAWARGGLRALLYRRQHGVTHCERRCCLLNGSRAVTHCSPLFRCMDDPCGHGSTRPPRTNSEVCFDSDGVVVEIDEVLSSRYSSSLTRRGIYTGTAVRSLRRFVLFRWGGGLLEEEAFKRPGLRKERRYVFGRRRTSGRTEAPQSYLDAHFRACPVLNSFPPAISKWGLNSFTPRLESARRRTCPGPACWARMSDSTSFCFIGKRGRRTWGCARLACRFKPCRPLGRDSSHRIDPPTVSFMRVVC